MKLSVSAYGLWAFSFVAAQRVQQPLQQETVSGKPVQVAIIGAGAAGSSAAYHLSQYAHNASLPINITIFESNSYIGGRSTTVTAYNLTTTELDALSSPHHYSTELGASIFVAVNHILVNAVETFNLSTSDDDLDNPKGHLGQEVGIWDGNTFVLQLDTSLFNGYWTIAKLLFRYGLAPIRTYRLTKSVISKFLKIYDAPIFPFESLTAAAQSVGLSAVTAATGEQYLRENGISAAFAREVVQASTRVNYAQNLEYIHGLEAMVCMATEGGAMRVQGGNWRIFEEMVKASEAHVRLGERVSSVTEKRDEKYMISVIDGDAGEEQQLLQEERDDGTAFDHVVVASPWQYADIDFGVFPEFRLPDKIPYVRLHVTLFTSPHLLDPEYFNLPKDQAVPQAILTTLPDGEPAHTGPEGVGHSAFFAISLLRPLTNPKTGREEYLYKIFSPKRISDEYLSEILDTEHSTDNGSAEAPFGNKENVTWIYRKIWNSYPYETPRVAFEDVQLSRNVWYTGGMDNFISTMETNALMGKNVAKLIVDAEQSKAERRMGMQMEEDMKARKQDL
ncbi:Farnesylcysteine lyase [Cercospora beticola]|uniref:Farnesylcysteine lyase n=1 Tax=Cercospora beticola TaxID=122368 RepID=A0A2G5HZ62_CERBT|nr:Farnesylcysteine lyase [Cercospora beticola]PIA97573.1 Farnesylcysteine lyase [Cercospora beticola]WPA97924.1 hypothetical protein RHO25_002535 [Cercospora beticola]